MVDLSYLEAQLKKIKFGTGRINRAEVRELQHILIPEETIYECVNGYYEGGMALLVATDIRVLLIDKKPMGFLNVDDVRFDMISDIDYNHRAFGASISINCGMRQLIFKSYNQPRLRKLIGHVQHRMSEIKKEQSLHAETQKQHLEEINKQLQMYLLAQQQHLEQQFAQNRMVNTIKPSPQLADYLFAQRLLENFHNTNNRSVEPNQELADSQRPEMVSEQAQQEPINNEPQDQQALLEELAEAGRMEVFGGTDKVDHGVKPVSTVTDNAEAYPGVDLTPFKIVYGKLPYLLRSK